VIHRVPVVKRAGYTIFIENYRNVANFLHCDVYKYSKSVRKQIGKDLDSLLELHNDSFYVLVELDNHKLKKFLQQYDFVLDHQPLCDDGIVREVYRLDRRK